MTRLGRRKNNGERRKLNKDRDEDRQERSAIFESLLGDAFDLNLSNKQIANAMKVSAGNVTRAIQKIIVPTWEHSNNLKDDLNNRKESAVKCALKGVHVEVLCTHYSTTDVYDSDTENSLISLLYESLGTAVGKAKGPRLRKRDGKYRWPKNLIAVTYKLGSIIVTLVNPEVAEDPGSEGETNKALGHECHHLANYFTKLGDGFFGEDDSPDPPLPPKAFN